MGMFGFLCQFGLQDWTLYSKAFGFVLGLLCDLVYLELISSPFQSQCDG